MRKTILTILVVGCLLPTSFLTISTANKTPVNIQPHISVGNITLEIMKPIENRLYFLGFNLIGFRNTTIIGRIAITVKCLGLGDINWWGTAYFIIDDITYGETQFRYNIRGELIAKWTWKGTKYIVNNETVDIIAGNHKVKVRAKLYFDLGSGVTVESNEIEVYKIF